MTQQERTKGRIDARDAPDATANGSPPLPPAPLVDGAEAAIARYEAKLAAAKEKAGSMKEPTVCGCLKCQGEWERGLPPETPMSERWAGPGRKGWRYACEVCGNKRCPHHSDHRLACTASNRPGQPGSVYA